MHLSIDSHSGFTKGPAPPTREPSRVVSSEYLDSPCNLSYETPSQSQRKQPSNILLNDEIGFSQIPESNRNSWMNVDPNVSQPTECRTNPFMAFALSHPFPIDLFDASERKHSPPGEPKCKQDPGMRSCRPLTLFAIKPYSKPATPLIS
jgi:hypothetical protein